MTHVYVYIKTGFSKDKIKGLISGIKNDVCQGFNIKNKASTVVVREVECDCCSDNLGVFALIYTPKGKGLDQKKQLVNMINSTCCEVLGKLDVKIIFKEQASDMSGINGVLRCNKRDLLTSYEID